MLNLRKLLLKDYLYICFVIIVIIFALIITKLYKYNSKYVQNNNTFIGIINEIKIDGNALQIELNAKEKIICNYYFETLEEKEKYKILLQLGDKIKLIGILSKPRNNTIPNLFNYKNYLYNNRIYWILEIKSIKLIQKNYNIFYYLKNIVIKNIETYKTKPYLYAFILGDTSKISNNITSSYQKNGISHLFAVSGMHVSFLTGILLLLLKKIKVKETSRYVLTILFLIFYMFLTNFSPSILRASLFFILLSINKIWYFNVKTINIVLLTLSIILLINPFLLYNLGFQFSYTISFFLILFQNLINQYKTYISKLFIVSLIAFLVSLPISIYNFFEVNLLSIMLNLIFVPFVSFILFPLSLITFFIPILDNILYILICILEKLSLFVSNIKFFNIILMKPNIFVILIYYFIIILILYKINTKKYQYIFLIFILMFFHTNFSYTNNKLYMVMIDVGQGDSILIVLPKSNETILIDTGGKMEYSMEKWKLRNSASSIANDKIIPFLKSLGIKKIDYLILTHGDYDHMGEAISLVNKFKVCNIIFNNGNYNDLELELINVLKQKNIKYYKNINVLNIYQNKLFFLNTIDYNNENYNSSVTYIEIDDLKMLFMGDAGTKREEDILKKYNIKNIDILKVGHHGSNTSSSKNFINSINPKTCLISVGKNNRYGHPKDSVLDILKKCCTYRTDLNGSIEVKFKNKKYRIKTFSP